MAASARRRLSGLVGRPATSQRLSSRARAAGRPGRASRPASPEEIAARVPEALELAGEIAQVALATGPRAVAVRTLQAADAGVELVRGALAGEPLQPAPVLRRLFERLGATYVKLGQFVASSPTLFPEEYVLEFQKCLDQTPPTPFPEIEAVLREELGVPVSQVFSYVDPVPLASASVAQVHSATLAGSGKDVVVKVLKPNVTEVLTTDLSFLYVLSRVLEFLQPQLARTSLANIVGDIRTSMLEEVDFTKEARNMGEFQRYLDATGATGAVVPFVYEQFSSERVLTMERLYGVPLTDLDSIRAASGGDPEGTLITALNTWIGSVLACESFHADVHAGNLLVLRDGRVGFLDFGIVGRISPTTFAAIQSLLNATAVGDYEMMARSLATMGATDAEVDIAAFAADLKQLYEDVSRLETRVTVTEQPDGTATVAAALDVDETEINRIVLDLVRTGDTHGVKFPREFGLLLKQVLYFDRYVQLLAPELSVLNDERIDLSRDPSGLPPRQPPPMSYA